MACESVTVVGAGLAGSECAFQLSRMGVPVRLREMKPHQRSPAHRSDGLAELVCSNSFRSDNPENAIGLLHFELRDLGSLILKCADQSRVPAGDALAVDREKFSQAVTLALKHGSGRNSTFTTRSPRSSLRTRLISPSLFDRADTARAAATIT